VVAHSGRGFSSWVGRGAATFESNIGGGNADCRSVEAYAAEVVTAVPDVILVGGTTALIPTQKATRSIPIVFVGSADPVGQGFRRAPPAARRQHDRGLLFSKFHSSASCWRRSRRSPPV